MSFLVEAKGKLPFFEKLDERERRVSVVNCVGLVVGRWSSLGQTDDDDGVVVEGVLQLFFSTSHF